MSLSDDLLVSRGLDPAQFTSVFSSQLEHVARLGPVNPGLPGGADEKARRPACGAARAFRCHCCQVRRGVLALSGAV